MGGAMLFSGRISVELKKAGYDGLVIEEINTLHLRIDHEVRRSGKRIFSGEG
jgi:hypothetical protein